MRTLKQNGLVALATSILILDSMTVQAGGTKAKGDCGSGRTVIASLSILERCQKVAFVSKGFASFTATPISAGIPGAEIYALSGQLSANAIPPFLTPGGGAAWLSEPGQPTLPSDLVSLQWDAAGNIYGFFLSVDDTALFGFLISPSWVSAPETGQPVTFPVLGVDAVLGLGTGGTPPFTLSVSSPAK